jgi:hypothetical protein
MRTARPFKTLPLGLCGLLAAAAPGLSLAQTNAQSLLNDSFNFNLGAFVVSSDIRASLNGASTTNPDVDFNKTLGNDKNSTRVRLDGLWRITPTQHLTLSYFDNNRSASKVLEQDVHWGDNVYHVGANVTSETKMQITALAYEYAFLRRPDYEVAASLGIHYSKVGLKLSGAASVTDGNGNVTQQPVATRSDSVPAPLPVIGLRGAWAAAPDWLLGAKAQFFKVNVQGIDGHWTDARLDATWMFTRHWGLGLGYDGFYNRVHADKDNFHGNLKYGYSGLQLFLTGSY